MTKTVIGTYEDMQAASAVVNDLVNAGFDRDNISIIAENADDRHSSYVRDNDSGADDVGKGAGIGAALGGVGGLLVGLGALAIPGVGPFVAAGPIAAALAGAGIGAVTGGVIGALVDLGIPEEEAHLYSESVRRGHVLVAAQVPDNQVAQASRIMERAGLVDLERHADEWRRSGQMPSTQQTTQTTQTTNMAANIDTQSRRRDNLNEDETIEIVEEDIHVGKRTVEGGGVRVRTYVREVPVEEQVRLREEHVEIERRKVDRPATASDIDAFREGTIEVSEMREEAVVGKEARVVEEVRIHKDVDERVETIRDTARRTEVDVEQMGTQRSGQGGQASNYEMYDTNFRSHWQTNYGSSGQQYDRYQPAYRYGYTLANDERYRGRNWNEIEPDVRRDWESRNQGPWENFKDSIRYSWDSVRGKH